MHLQFRAFAVLLLAFKSLTSYVLGRASNLICCTTATANFANKHSLPDADDHRLLAEHTRVDFSLRARAIEKHFICRCLSLVSLAPLSLSLSIPSSLLFTPERTHVRIRVRRLSLEFERSRNLLYKYYRATRWRRDKAIVALCTLNNRVASCTRRSNI